MKDATDAHSNVYTIFFKDFVDCLLAEYFKLLGSDVA